ncbi:hypothetical protein [Nonomuraea sp. B19D2]|uniref:hypothetical protein n=1 Tax=Nonomuraea sp. B19D2 TaxID=3159561 RepID=UPI0032DA2A7D
MTRFKRAGSAMVAGVLLTSAASGLFTSDAAARAAAERWRPEARNGARRPHD